MKIKLNNGKYYNASTVDKNYDIENGTYSYNMILTDVSSTDEFETIVQSIYDTDNKVSIVVEREDGNIEISGVELAHATLNIFDSNMQAFMIFDYPKEIAENA